MTSFECSSCGQPYSPACVAFGMQFENNSWIFSCHCDESHILPDDQYTKKHLEALVNLRSIFEKWEKENKEYFDPLDLGIEGTRIPFECCFCGELYTLCHIAQSMVRHPSFEGWIFCCDCGGEEHPLRLYYTDQQIEALLHLRKLIGEWESSSKAIFIDSTGVEE